LFLGAEGGTRTHTLL